MQNSLFSTLLITTALSASIASLANASSLGSDSKLDAGQTIQQLKSNNNLDNKGARRLQKLNASDPKEETNNANNDSTTKSFKHLKAKSTASDVKTPSVLDQVDIAIKSLTIEGNNSFSSKELEQAFKPIIEAAKKSGNNYLTSHIAQQITQAITQYYRSHDYIFASASLSLINSKDGDITNSKYLAKYKNNHLNKNGSNYNVAKIIINEGRYGDVSVIGDKRFHNEVLAYFKDLKGKPINGKELEKIALIAKDLGGYKITPILRKGKESNTTDLVVNVSKDKTYGGSITVNNYGSRYLGTHQALLAVHTNSNFRLGDQITLNLLKSQGDLFYGAIAYDTPINSKGTKLSTNYSRTNYQLGKEYKSLDSHGTAEVFATAISHPVTRSQRTNVEISAAYNHKWFTDKQDSNSNRTKKHSDVVPIALTFDKKDSILGGGVSFGSLSWTQGILSLGSTLKDTDTSTAKTDGYFSKVAFDLARVQTTKVNNLSAFVHTFGQFAQHNLDSSEKFGLGGPNAVRAYPIGEGYGDQGHIVQAELRYNIKGRFTPYAFYDYGKVKVNHNKWTVTNNERSIAGAGFGLKAQFDKLSLNSAIAWRTTSNSKPVSDSKAGTPMIWFSTNYQF